MHIERAGNIMRPGPGLRSFLLAVQLNWDSGRRFLENNPKVVGLLDVGSGGRRSLVLVFHASIFVLVSCIFAMDSSVTTIVLYVIMLL